MVQNHIILALAWIVFCIIHSFLASLSVKQKIGKSFAAQLKWYRPAYVLIAALTFGAILFYQFSINTALLYKINTAALITGSIIGISGIIIMLICIVKYFSLISGLSSLLVKNSNHKLLTTGLHRYVRHPLYFGTFLFIWGVFIAIPYLSWLISSSIITLYTLIGIRYEEAKLEMEYGESYKEYKRRVPMILPKTRISRIKNTDFPD
jgi:methanethiol S-methyltransferase